VLFEFNSGVFCQLYYIQFYHIIYILLQEKRHEKQGCLSKILFGTCNHTPPSIRNAQSIFSRGKKAKDIAKHFGVSHFSLYSLIRDFKKSIGSGESMQFFVEPKTGPKTDRKKPKVREHVLRLRTRGYADTDIHKALRLVEHLYSDCHLYGPSSTICGVPV